MGIPYIGIATIIALISAVIIMSIKILIIKNKKRNNIACDVKYEIVQGVFFIYCIFIIVCTLTPSGIQRRSINLIPFRDNIEGIQFVGYIQLKMMFYNILLFIPYGLIGAWMMKFQSKKNSLIIIYGMLFTIVIESLQYILGTGRATDIDDIIMNILGTIIGYTVVMLVYRVASVSRVKSN